MFDRAVLHLDLDAFFVSVEQLRNSSLKNKPIIIGGSSQRGVVASCSYEARRHGVHSAMPMKMALRLCPDAQIIKGDMEEYSHQSKIITEIIRAKAPIFEKASIDEFYLDLTGMDRYVGTWQWSKELKQKIIKESGLPISIGLSINKLVSKVGVGLNKPDAAKVIFAGDEKTFLAPLAIHHIPSIGKETQKKLAFMGVRRVQTLAKTPPLLLQRAFGKFGLSLWKKANGIDTSPVVPYNERKSMSTERTFQMDTIDIQWLKSKLTDMIGQLAFELRQSQKLTSCITVKLRYTDFNTFTKQRIIPYTAHDHELQRHALELFEKLYERRQLVRLIGVRFSSLVNGHYQVNLFNDTLKEVKILQTMDQIRKRFGKQAIKIATAIPGKSKRQNKRSSIIFPS